MEQSELKEYLESNLRKISEQYSKETGQAAHNIKRNYYRAHEVEEYKNSYEKIYKTFDNFKKAALEGLAYFKKISDFSEDFIINEFLTIAEQFQKEHPKSKLPLSREYYKKHSELDYSEIEKTYGSFENLKNKAMGGEESIKNFELGRQLLYLKEEVTALKKERDYLLKGSVNEDKLIEIFENKVLTLKIPKEIKITNTKSGRDAEAILALSDWHAGSVITKAETNNINEYNIDIMKKRIDRVFHYFLYYCKKFDITTANLTFLGDLWENAIHMETARTNYPSEPEILFILHEYITEKLLQIEASFKNINVYAVVGNHSRISNGNPAGNKYFIKEAPVLSWEYILFRQLALLFEKIQSKQKIKKINFHISTSLSKIIEVAQRKFLLTHSITQGGGGSFGSIPYYAIDKNSAKKFGIFYQIQDYDQIFSDVLYGHLHSSARTKIISGTAYGVGGTVGTDPFALEKLKVLSEPEQLLLFVEKGIVTDEILLKCEDPFKKKS